MRVQDIASRGINNTGGRFGSRLLSVLVVVALLIGVLDTTPTLSVAPTAFVSSTVPTAPTSIIAEDENLIMDDLWRKIDSGYDEMIRTLESAQATTSDNDDKMTNEDLAIVIIALGIIIIILALQPVVIQDSSEANT